VACPVSRRATRQLTYRHRGDLCGFSNPGTALQDLSRFPDTTPGLHPVASPLALWTTLCGQPWSATASHPDRLRSLGPYARRSDRLLLFLPGPQRGCPVRQEPTTTSRSRMVVGPCGPPNPYAVCSPLAGGAVCSVIVTHLPSHPIRHRMLTLKMAPTSLRLVAALGC
jgi:hypothetical protein